MTQNRKVLKRGEIRRNVSSSYYDRGRRYFEQGRVSSLRVEAEDDSSVQLSATVKGRGRNSYRQQIRIHWVEGQVDIHGICSCPMHFNCKHVVAAALQYQLELSRSRAAPPVSGDQCLEWLQGFVKATVPAESARSDEHLFYILHPGEQPGELRVEFRVCRYLKRGGIGKGRPVELSGIADGYYRPRYLQPIDAQISSLLEICNEGIWYGDPRIRGDVGFLALSKMLQTGRCHWRLLDSPPVVGGEERTLRVEWQPGEHGEARLHLGVVEGGGLLLTEPPLYLDHGEEGAVIGPLKDNPFTAQQLAQLLRAPAVPAEQIEAFSRRLLQELPVTPLPPPQEVEVVELSGEAPQPVLCLRGEAGPEGTPFHTMRLRFRYRGHEIHYLPLTEAQNIFTAESVLRVWRDPHQENAAIGRIHGLGFQPRTSADGRDVEFFNQAEGGPMEITARWHHFLTQTVPELEAEGWLIEFDDTFQIRFHAGGDWSVELDGEGDWFDLRFDVEIEGERYPLLPLIAPVLEHHEPGMLPETLTIPMGENRYLTVPRERIEPVLDTLYELYDSSGLEEGGALRLSRFDAGRLAELEERGGEALRWRSGKSLRQLGRKLRGFQGIEEVKPPRGLRTTLRRYQQEGLNWLQFLRKYEFGGVLADDMGLGKTVQTLAHLLLEKQRGRMDRPCLIIAPTSLMSNWRREAERFTPRLKVLVLQGPDRHQRFGEMAQYDLLLSTYPLLVRDEEQLLGQEYHYLILDEAQTIKNPRAKAAQVVRKIRTRHRLCLTGTPMENHLGELWALFDFLMPGFLGESRHFKQLFRNPIEKEGDEECRKRLARRVAPFMLRRTKAEVADELPEKTEIVRSVTLGNRQAALYESIRVAMEKRVRDAIASKGLARSHITILDALLKLRQTCCDPRLLSLRQARKVEESAKLELLLQILPEMVEEGRRILLFSQFTKMLGIIESELKRLGMRYSKLTGQTRKRDEAIERFRSGAADIFLISLKAGGVGLNLTEADTVIHYDPWWNPAVENQATDRAHRIGQEKAVFVYKLITENTVEEKILAMQEKKHALAQGIYAPGERDAEMKLSAEELQQLFAPLEQDSSREG